MQNYQTIHHKGESAASHLLQHLQQQEDEIKRLGYYLYQLFEQKKWSEDANNYNMLIQSWPELKKAA